MYDIYELVTLNRKVIIYRVIQEESAELRGHINRINKAMLTQIHLRNI